MTGNVWSLTSDRACIIPLTGDHSHLASMKHWNELNRDLRPIYATLSPDAARDRFDKLKEKWGTRCPVIVGLWENSWYEFIPFLDCDVEIMKVITSTNASKASTPATAVS